MPQPTTPVKMELKYCERCGSLWLRPVGDPAAYCPPCAGEMAQLPALPRSLRGQAELVLEDLPQVPAPDTVRLV